MRVAVHALQGECELLQTCGLLPRDLGTLRLQRLQPTERIPSGEELQALFATVVIHPSEVTSDAERDWLHGDGAASHAAALEADDTEH